MNVNSKMVSTATADNCLDKERSRRMGRCQSYLARGLLSLSHSLSKFHTVLWNTESPLYLSPKFNRFNQDFATLHLSFLFYKKNSKEDFDIILLFRRFREESRGLYFGDGQRPLSLNTSFRNNKELAFPMKRFGHLYFQ